MKKLVFASTNPGKIGEIRSCFSVADGIEILSLKDFSGIGEIEETGVTYEENARLKAKIAFEKTGIPALGDDAGFEVEYLGGEPGIRSHRWLGDAATSYDRALGIITRLEGVPAEKRGARMGSVLTFYDGSKFYLSQNWVYGSVPDRLGPDKIQEGFPYKSVLFLKEFKKLYKDLTPEEFRAVNHRIKNVYALKPEILMRISNS